MATYLACFLCLGKFTHRPQSGMGENGRFPHTTPPQTTPKQVILPHIPLWQDASDAQFTPIFPMPYTVLNDQQPVYAQQGRRCEMQAVLLLLVLFLLRFGVPALIVYVLGARQERQHEAAF